MDEGHQRSVAAHLALGRQPEHDSNAHRAWFVDRTAPDFEARVSLAFIRMANYFLPTTGIAAENIALEPLYATKSRNSLGILHEIPRFGPRNARFL